MQKTNRCIIIGGADINNIEYVRSKLCKDDYIVYCDSGLKHMQALGADPNLIVGDFDSYDDPHLDAETIVLPCEKDDTDTVFAVKEAVKRGYDDFLLLGVAGARLDHTLANVSILLYLDSLGKNGCIIDDYSLMKIVSSKPVMIREEYPFFSLINISGNAEGITITGAKYPLINQKITCEYQYGISHQVLAGHTATVSVKQGRLLAIMILPQNQRAK